MSRFALHPNTPAHHLDQLPGDSQPQSCPSIPARGATVRLGETIEDQFLLILRDTDARIGYREEQLDILLIRPLQANFNGDFAFVGELDGVAHQIDQHLAEPQRVTPHCHRHVRVDVEKQLQILPRGPLGHDIGKLFHNPLQVVIYVFQFQPAGLNLGEIEDVVEQAQQDLSRSLHCVQVLALFSGQPGSQGQLDHADDTVHGGANLVAHVRQERALGLVGFFRNFLRLLQSGCGPFAVGDVVADTHQSDNFSLRVSQRDPDRQEPPLLPVGSENNLLPFDQVPGADDRLISFVVSSGLSLREEIEIRFPNNLAGGTGPHGAGMGNVVEYHPALGILHVDGIRQVVNHGAQQVALLRQGFLGPLLLGDVRNEGDLILPALILQIL